MRIADAVGHGESLSVCDDELVSIHHLYSLRERQRLAYAVPHEHTFFYSQR